MVIIIGAGLSGLVSAYRLKQANVPFKILEARDRLGGRIFTKITENGTPIEMGATWFGRPHQNLIKLLNELGLSAFPQFQGDYYYYDDVNSSHHGKYKLPAQETNYRITGGSKSLIYSLAEKLDPEDLYFNIQVREVKQVGEQLIISSEQGDKFVADQVVLALPPKIWSHQIRFEPSLQENVQQNARDTQTWMEDSIKAGVEFKEPFWRKNDLPATIMSNSGPFVECYDHSNQQENKFALCGFLNPEVKRLNKTERENEVIKQLASILGNEAHSFVSYEEYIWSDDELVKWPKDTSLMPHQNNGNPCFREPLYDHKLIISSSESASRYPGYMDGAIEAGERAFKVVKEKIKQE
jgi:monoamine oxidase